MSKGLHLLPTASPGCPRVGVRRVEKSPYPADLYYTLYDLRLEFDALCQRYGYTKQSSPVAYPTGYRPLRRTEKCEKYDKYWFPGNGCWITNHEPSAPFPAALCARKIAP